MKTCVLVDGHSEAYRAYYALLHAGLSARRTGEPTGAIFGFLRQLFAVMREYSPDYLVVAFDPPHTFRQNLYGEYKATRARMPDELARQITHIQHLLEAMGVCHVTVENYEADDVIGTLSARAEAEGMRVLVKTGDRDLFQLASVQTRILYTSARQSARGDEVYDATAVAERFGVAPAQFIQMKALQGDSSDNIPGVPGVGEKSAVKLVQQFASIDQLYARLAEVKGPKLQRNLLEHRKRVQRNLELVQIVRDMDFDFAWDTAAPASPDTQAVETYLRGLDLHSALAQFHELFAPVAHDLFGQAAPRPEMVRTQRTAAFRCIQTRDQLQALVTELEQSPILAFDFETDAANPLTADMVGLAVGWARGEAAYIPIHHRQGEQLDWADVQQALNPCLADAGRIKVAHNAKFDFLIARRYGLDVGKSLHDTLLMAWVLDPGRRGLGLKDLALQELGIAMQPIKDLIGTGRKQIAMSAVAIEQAAPYASDDAAQTWELYHVFRPRLEEAGMWPLYVDLELPLIPILADIETHGVMLDRDYLVDLQAEFETRLENLAAHMYSLVGYPFNLRSPQQLSPALFNEDTLNLPSLGLKRLKAGGFSTAAGVLENLAVRAERLNERQRESLDTILQFRQLDKLKSTYVDSLLALIGAGQTRVHTSFNQAGAATGRMSSNNPNLQNIPIRSEEGRRLRRAFTVPEGRILVAADYNQIELRVLAHTVEETGLMQAFADDQDIHAITASELFQVPLSEVSRTQRGLAKTINFATIYGVTAFGLSSRTDMSISEAEDFLNRYFATYPRVEQYIRDTVRQVTQQGYVETLTGRKRFFLELQNTRLTGVRRGAIERAAINAPIQGSAADIIKIAMRKLVPALKADSLQGCMILQVHDELVLEAPRDERDAVAARTRGIMENAYRLRVPLKVDIEYGTNWRDLTPIPQHGV